MIIDPALRLLDHVDISLTAARRRLHLSSFTLGALLSALLISSYSYTLPRATAAVREPPVRLHFANDPTKNTRPFASDCPLDVIFTTDPNAADVNIYSTDKFGLHLDFQQLRKEYPFQSHAIWSVESAPNRQQLYGFHNLQAAGLQNTTYDFDMTYRLESDVPMPYAYHYFDFDNPGLRWEQKRHDKIMVAVVSNCWPSNDRNLVLEYLMQLLPGQIDVSLLNAGNCAEPDQSFGPCMNNAEMEPEYRRLNGLKNEDPLPADRWSLKTGLVKHYKFTVAFENSNEIDYVTEKPMEMGSVPIHMGSPTFNSSFLPSANAAIDLAAYLPSSMMALSKDVNVPLDELPEAAKAGLARLATELQHLSSEKGRRRYEAMMDWKRNGKWRYTPFGQVVKLGRMR